MAAYNLSLFAYMMYGMAKVELLYFDGCPGYRKA